MATAKGLEIGNCKKRMCELTEPVVDPQIRNKIPNKHVVESIGSAKYDEHADSDGKAEITQQDKLSILSFVKRTRWVEVVDTAGKSIFLALATSLSLLLMVVVPGSVGEEIQNPSCKLLSNQMRCSENGCLLTQFRNFVCELTNTRGINVQSLWQENHVALHVSCGFVVLSVRNFPGEVWNNKCRMTDPTNGVVQNL